MNFRKFGNRIINFDNIASVEFHDPDYLGYRKTPELDIIFVGGEMLTFEGRDAISIFNMFTELLEAK